MELEVETEENVGSERTAMSGRETARRTCLCFSEQKQKALNDEKKFIILFLK